MSYLKKFGLVLSGVAICLSLYVTAIDAQWRQNGSWQNRNRNVYSERNRNRGIYRNNRYVYRQQYGYGRVSPREYWRLQRQRSRINRSANRYYRDGYLSYGERLRLQRQQYRYRRNVIRDRRDW